MREYTIKINNFGEWELHKLNCADTQKPSINSWNGSHDADTLPVVILYNELKDNYGLDAGFTDRTVDETLKHYAGKIMPCCKDEDPLS